MGMGVSVLMRVPMKHITPLSISRACGGRERFPEIIISILLLRLGRAAAPFEYLRVGHYLVQKGSVHNDCIVHCCELLPVAHVFDENSVFAQECENVFVVAIITGWLSTPLSKAAW